MLAEFLSVGRNRKTSATHTLTIRDCKSANKVIERGAYVMDSVISNKYEVRWNVGRITQPSERLALRTHLVSEARNSDSREIVGFRTRIFRYVCRPILALGRYCQNSLARRLMSYTRIFACR